MDVTENFLNILCQAKQNYICCFPNFLCFIKTRNMSLKVEQPVKVEDANENDLNLYVGHVIYATSKNPDKIPNFVRHSQRVNYKKLNQTMASHPNLDRMALFLSTDPLLSPAEILYCGAILGNRDAIDFAINLGADPNTRFDGPGNRSYTASDILASNGF